MGSEIELINAATGTLSTVVLIPATFVRALAIADSFAYYRFKKVKVTIYPNVYEAIDIQTQLTVGYLPGVAPDTPPANDDSVFQMSKHVKHGYGKCTNTTMTVPYADLVGDAQVKWFKTIAGTPDAQFEIQGNFFFWPVTRGASAASAASYNVGFDYTIEFQNFVAPSNTPFLRFKMLKSKEDKEKAVLELAGERYLKLDEEMLASLGLN